MYASAVILFGLLAIPQVLGSRADPFRTDFDFTKSRRGIDPNFGFTKLRGGIDPEIIKRHVCECAFSTKLLRQPISRLSIRFTMSLLPHESKKMSFFPG